MSDEGAAEFAKQKGAEQVKSSRNFNIAGKVLSSLHAVRDPLADYQERGGTPRDQSSNFIPLLTNLAQDAYNVTIAVLVMLYSFIPLFDGFLSSLRFILDGLIDIMETDNLKDKILKSILFLIKLVIIVLALILIISFIVYPVWQLAWHLFGKFWSMIFSFT